ncbi:thiamine-phosphate kinase [Nitrospira moscoviensis]|uniref:thiamine-phosphate kinase n=1 Tax=Nitrospira moscoviensis TaxID=42253 RepID=UPI0006A7803A|nr:thiamine-phosphate kinase [Nitrospira moscoviensis]
MAPRQARHPLSEFGLIRTLQRRFPSRDNALIRGIGDDAAVVAMPAGRHLVLTTDLLAEGVHFDLRTASFEDVGYKAAIANLSDVAAMGARPEHVLVALAAPAACAAPQILQLYKGLMAACRPYRVSLIGGDTSASANGWFLSVTVTGTVPAGSALLRSGARVGDAIYVTGTLGDSLAGLQLLSRRRPMAATRLPPADRRFLLRRHRRPLAHCRFGQLLGTHRLATAAIDLSDGLSGDIRHLCEESRVGAELHTAALPLSPALTAYAKAAGTDPAALALQGGEDYELLFTVSPANLRRLQRAAGEPGRRLTRIGVIQPKSFGIRLRDASGNLRRLPVTSYEHFRS